MCSFCWQKCEPRLKLLLRLKIQHLGVYTYWFSHMCLILLLAYKRNQRIVIGKSEALLWWLAICLLFLWFYLPSVWWLEIGLHEEPANFCREKRSVAFVTSHFFTFLLALSPICLVTTQQLICENQTIWRLKILLRMIVAALLMTKCNGRFVQNKRCQETGKEYFTIVEMNVKEQYLMPDYAKPSPPSAPQTHTYQQKGHCLPNDLCPSHTAFFRFPSQIKENIYFIP